MSMFRLRGGPNAAASTPGQVMEAGTQGAAEVVEMDVVGQGLALNASYMSTNGPAQPTHNRPQVMTKQQLEEQKMNEAQGLPSNRDEASRVVALETTVSNLNENMGKITGLLSQLVQGQSPVAQPLTPPVKPAVVAQPPPLPPTLPEEGLPLQTSPLPGPLMVPTMPDLAPPTSPPASSPQPMPPEVSPEMKAPTVSMGTAGSVTSEPTVQDFDQYEVVDAEAPVTELSSRDRDIFQTMLAEDAEPNEVLRAAADRYNSPSPEQLISPGENQVAGSVDVTTLVEVEETPKVDAAEAKRVERHQILTSQTMDWIKTRDSHKFWRRFLSGSCNKNLSYNTWPPEFQAAFDERFNAMVNDPCFVSTLCGRIIRMQNGHLVACHVAGAFVVATAGFLSFSLLEA